MVLKTVFLLLQTVSILLKVRTKVAFFQLRRNRILASLSPYNQIFIFLKDLLENNAKKIRPFVKNFSLLLRSIF